jgi:hypothetical protein
VSPVGDRLAGHGIDAGPGCGWVGSSTGGRGDWLIFGSVTLVLESFATPCAAMYERKAAGRSLRFSPPAAAAVCSGSWVQLSS